MGRKRTWFGAVKRALIPNCCHRQPIENLDKSKHSDPLPTKEVETTAQYAAQLLPPAPILEVKPTEKGDEQSKHSYSVALASAVAAEAAAVAAQAAAEVVRLTTLTPRLSGESREEIAAIKIQTAFRGYLARRALQALRGVVRLKRLLDGNAVKSQTMNALHCMQTMGRVQTQIHARRSRMTEENRALQRHLQWKHEKELEKVKIKEGWDDSIQSKDQIEANILNKQEAAIRRERALAYAFSHQWKSSSRSLTTVFTDPSNPQWGWSWLERWMAARPWEKHSSMEVNDHASIKSASHGIIGQTTKRRDSSLERTPLAAQKSSRPSSRQSPATPRSKAPSVASRKKSVSPRGSWRRLDDDLRSVVSLQSERRRRYNIAESSAIDDESLVSSPAVPTYMASTESTRARSQFHSPQSDRTGIPEQGSICSVKKRLSFPISGENSMLSPASIRRHSGPPKVDIPLGKDVATNEEQVTNN